VLNKRKQTLMRPGSLEAVIKQFEELARTHPMDEITPSPLTFVGIDDLSKRALTILLVGGIQLPAASVACRPVSGTPAQVPLRKTYGQ
jgi:hypothetical protein